MSEVKIKTYRTVDDAVKEGSYYIVNTSSGPNKERVPGNLVMGLRSRDGGNVQILIPPTWIPFDLREYATPEDISSSNAIRQNLRNGLLVFISVEDYEMLRNRPEYENEKARVSKLRDSYSMNGLSDTTLNISPNVSAGPSGGNVQVSATPITDMIIASQSNEDLLRNYDTNLMGLQLGELKYIQTKATPGTLLSLISLELESYLMSGGIKIKTVRETEAYKEAVQRGILTNAPTLHF